MSRTSAHGTTGRRSSSLALRTTQPTLTSGKHKTGRMVNAILPEAFFQSLKQFIFTEHVFRKLKCE